MAELLKRADTGRVQLDPRQPRAARSSTTQTRRKQDRSPGGRPMTLTRRRVSPKVPHRLGPGSHGGLQTPAAR
jgi:hypothetical protein